MGDGTWLFLVDAVICPFYNVGCAKFLSCTLHFSFNAYITLYSLASGHDKYVKTEKLHQWMAALN